MTQIVFPSWGNPSFQCQTVEQHAANEVERQKINVFFTKIGQGEPAAGSTTALWSEKLKRGCPTGAAKPEGSSRAPLCFGRSFLPNGWETDKIPHA
jgi:hypothetical protein